MNAQPDSHVDEQFLRAMERPIAAGRHSRGKPPIVMYWWPSMRLADEQTTYLADLHAANRKPRYLRNVAHGLSIFHDYLAMRPDPRPWQVASLDDLLEFKDALEDKDQRLIRSLRPYETGTVAQHMIRALGFYAHGAAAGWYTGDLANRVQFEGKSTRGLSGLSASKYVPAVNPSNQRGQPIPPEHVTTLMDLAEASESLEGNDESCNVPSFAMSRDQILVSFGWAVGLRVGEIVGKKGPTCGQFDAVNPDPSLPRKELKFNVQGKGGKARQVGVPTWLILATKAYLGECDADEAKTRSNRLIFDIGVRRAEQIVTGLCFKAGFVAPECPSRFATKPKPLALYRFHDLRHSYAVAMYYAEIALGNPEPWKSIQVQLGHAHLQTTINTYLRWVGGATPYRLATATGLLGLPAPVLGK